MKINNKTLCQASPTCNDRGRTT